MLAVISVEGLGATYCNQQDGPMSAQSLAVKARTEATLCPILKGLRSTVVFEGRVLHLQVLESQAGDKVGIWASARPRPSHPPQSRSKAAPAWFSRALCSASSQHHSPDSQGTGSSWLPWSRERRRKGISSRDCSRASAATASCSEAKFDQEAGPSGPSCHWELSSVQWGL